MADCPAVATHQTNELTHDSQAEAYRAVCVGCIRRQRGRLEQCVDAFGGNADAGVFDLQAQFGFATAVADGQRDSTPLGVSDCVVEKIAQHLSDAARVTDAQRFGRAAPRQLQRNVFPRGRTCVFGHAAVDKPAQVERLRSQANLTVVEARVVDHIVEGVQQLTAASLQLLDELGLHRCELRSGQLV